MDKISTSIQSILIIDQNDDFFTNLNSIFIFYQITAKNINNGIEAIKEIEANFYDCFIISSQIHEISVLFLVDQIKGLYPNAIVVILLENPTIDQVIEYTAYGVDNFIQKPFTWEAVEKVLTFYNY